jgi:hypothetical protein
MRISSFVSSPVRTRRFSGCLTLIWGTGWTFFLRLANSLRSFPGLSAPVLSHCITSAPKIKDIFSKTANFFADPASGGQGQGKKAG